MTTITELWRYPVKSLRGESVPSIDVDERGLAGDRRWALVNTETGKALTARREPALLTAAAQYLDGTDEVVITLPDGTSTAEDAALSAWLGYGVELTKAAADLIGSYEIATDFEDETGSEWVSWDGPSGTFHDSGRTQVSLASAGAFGTWEAARFRINLITDGAVSEEDAWVGSSVALGSATADVTKRIDRCVMITRPQPGGIERNLEVLRTINAQRDGALGVGLRMTRSGTISVGDQVEAG